MPPRYSYWTILAGGLPTAFRAAERADLLPTFNRIRDKHPDAEMKWFARGRLWESPEAAQEDLQRVRARRDREWRPGGDHRDPRKKSADVKRAGKSARPSVKRLERPAAPSGSKDRAAPTSRNSFRGETKLRRPRPERRPERSDHRVKGPPRKRRR
jgi:hypothetical protein